MSIEEKYDEVRQLITVGKEKGYLLYDEVNELLPSEITSSEELDDLFAAGPRDPQHVAVELVAVRHSQLAGLANDDGGRDQDGRLGVDRGWRLARGRLDRLAGGSRGVERETASSAAADARGAGSTPAARRPQARALRGRPRGAS